MDSLKNKNEVADLNEPLNLSYMKRIKTSMERIGAWPKGKFGKKRSLNPLKNMECLFPIGFNGFVTGVLYIRANIKVLNFFILGHSYITVFMNACGLQRLAMTWTESYREVTKEFVQKVHLYHHKDQNEYAMKVHKEVHMISATFTMILHLQMYCGIILFNLAPLYNNIHNGMFSKNRPINGTFEHSVYYLMPFDYSHNLAGYIVLFIYNWPMSYLCSASICFFDLWLSIIVFHVWGHFKILIHNLENFPSPQLDISTKNKDSKYVWFDEEETNTAIRTIKENIDHHRMIAGFMKRTSNAWGPMLALYYAFHQISGCILLLEVSKLDAEALARYGPLTLILFQQLIQLSVVFELIASKSDNIKHAVYSIPWECMPPRARRIVFFFLCNVQEPISLKALGMVSVGVVTMSTIIKNSCSYFLMLRTVATK